jgi:hydrogenase maturation protease
VTRALVAGIGNVLRGDDGFGPAVVDALNTGGGLDNARALDVGIGGIALVHELMAGYDALIVVDCVRRGGMPGSLYVLDVDVPDVKTIGAAANATLAMDMHDVGPDNALVVARAAGVLPSRVWLVGCEPDESDDQILELSAPVRAALPRAVEAVRAILRNTTRHRVEGGHGGY